jgi:hypothetical protein
MIINIETLGLQSMSTHPSDNWMGDGYMLVPPELEEKALLLAPHCELVFDEGGALVDLTDDGTRPEAGFEPQDELTQLQLAVAELYERIEGGDGNG